MARSGRLGAGLGMIVAAALAGALVAELAVHVLAPDVPGPPPAHVEASDVFDQSQIDRARDFRDGQRTLFLIGLGLELGALGLLAAGRPQGMRGWLERAGSRPVLGAAAAGAAISLALAVIALPVGLIAHERAADVGLATNGLTAWLADDGRSAAITAALTAAGATLLLALQRHLPRSWWAATAALVVVYAAISSLLAPVVLAPLFNDFVPLPPGPARSAVIDLADRAGVDVGEVYSVDASRRSTALNAYVDGIGSTKRVVLYDNLLDRADAAVLRSVVAHELGHVAHDDVPRGILFVALIAPLGMLTVALVGTVLARRTGAEPGFPAAFPAFALVLTLATFALGLAGDQLSRNVEASADAFALRLTDDPRAFIELQRRLALSNLSDPDPPSPLDALLRSHPTTVERIGAALSYERPPREGAKRCVVSRC